jgi:hypothetical protein
MVILCTGEAFVFMKIADDPSMVYYYLSIPNEDMEQVNDRHRTAVAQVLAFTLQSLATTALDQSWHDTADKLDIWNVKYEDALRNIPPTDRKDRPQTPYKLGGWKKAVRSRVKTRSQCQPVADQMGSEDDLPPPPPSPSDGGHAQQATKEGKEKRAAKAGCEER